MVMIISLAFIAIIQFAFRNGLWWSFLGSTTFISQVQQGVIIPAEGGLGGLIGYLLPFSAEVVSCAL